MWFLQTALDLRGLADTGNVAGEQRTGGAQHIATTIALVATATMEDAATGKNDKLLHFQEPSFWVALFCRDELIYFNAMKIKVFPKIKIESGESLKTALEEVYVKIQKRAEKKDPLAKDLFVMCSVAQELWNQLDSEKKEVVKKNA